MRQQDPNPRLSALRQATRTQSLIGLTAMLSLSPAALASENPGAHEHGHAVLQAAFEGSRIDLVLETPAYNLAGFEHAPRTDDEKARLAAIGQWLGDTPLITTEQGTCTVTAATVELTGMETAEDEAHGDHHDHHDDHHDHGHDEHDHDDHSQTTHSEYEVSQQIECDSVPASQTLTTPLLSRFEKLQELAVEWVHSSGQGSTRLTQAEPPTFTPGR